MALTIYYDGMTVAEYCVALYDYEETCHEELTFEEGELIKIIARSVHDVDDGWWMGEMSNGQQGLFPSLVVEECGSNGEPLTPDVRKHNTTIKPSRIYQFNARKR